MYPAANTAVSNIAAAAFALVISASLFAYAIIPASPTVMV